MKRPIIWGLIFFGIGALGWLISVILTVITLGTFKFLTYIFGYTFILSLPLAAIAELILWLRRKKQNSSA